MERRIEHRDLRQPGAEGGARGEDTAQVVGIVQRREIDRVLDATKDRVVSSRCAKPSSTRNSRLRYVLAGVAEASSNFSRSSSS